MKLKNSILLWKEPVYKRKLAPRQTMKGYTPKSKEIKTQF